jgi:peptidoglycan/xylan/chitin deacetylase (PgdA/CDA1 family)
MNRYGLSATLIAILLLSALFAGLATSPAAAQASTSDTPHTNADSNLVSTSVQASNVKHFIFRDDDISPFMRLDALKAVNQVHIDENVPVTLGIIAHPNLNVSGNELLTDKETLSYLQSLTTNPLFELAQHGYTHRNDTQNKVGSSEFRGSPYIDQFNAMKQGRDDITEALGVTPTTFIPPWDAGDQNTLKAATALGFTLYSTGGHDFGVRQATNEGIKVQAASFIIGGFATSMWQTNMANLTRNTDAALNSASAGQNFVLLYHYWQFLAPDGSVDPGRLSLFEQYIDHLKARGDVQFTTLDNQNALPLSAKTQVTLTALGTTPTDSQLATFTATLSRRDPATNQWVAVASGEPIQIWHALNGVRYNDTTIDTNSNGQITYTASWTTPDYPTYYVSFLGDSAYSASTSPVTNTVSLQTQVALASWGIIPAVN